MDGKQQRIKERCEDDFTFFVRYFFKHRKNVKFAFCEFHLQVCEKLMDVYYGRTRHLIINLPPRHSKTELAVIMFSAWSMMKNPCSEFIHLSFSDELALDNSNAIREILKSEEFTALWPHIKTKKDVDSKKAWAVEQGGRFFAGSAGGQITGKGAGSLSNDRFSGAIIIDDPLKPDDALSNTKRERVNERWHNTIKSRFNSKDTPCIVLMQRIHENDFCGMLLADEEYDFEHVIMPAILDEDTDKERALWPARIPLEDLKRRQKVSRYVFSGQYQQRPSPLGGGLLKGAWFGRYKVLPKLKWRAVFVDTAQKSKEHNDYQVAGCFGLGEDGYLYMIDILRQKFDAYELEKKIPDFWRKHKADTNGRLRYMMVEDAVSGTTLIQKIRNEIVPKIPLREIRRDRDKLSRVMDVQGYVESGYVKLPENASWVFDFIKECESFTPDDTHAYDDQVDVLVDAITEMLHRKSTRMWEAL